MTVHGLRQVTGVHLPPTHLPHLTPGATVYSNNWSGYATLPKTGTSTRFRFVAADFNIPSAVCGPLGSSGEAVYSSWVGLDGYSDSTVEQTGIIAACTTTGGPAYYAFYEMVPLAPVLFTGVSPGDAIKVSAYYNHTINKYSLALTDVTTGSFVNTTQPCPSGSVCRNTSAEVISEANGGGPPTVDLPDFGMENYTAAAVTSTSGVKGTLAANTLWSSSEIIMKDSGNGHTMATPSTLYGGAAFNVLWQAAA